MTAPKRIVVVGASLAGAYSGFVHLVALWLPVNLVGLALLWKNNLSLRDIASTRRTGGLEAAGGGSRCAWASSEGASPGWPPPTS